MSSTWRNPGMKIKLSQLPTTAAVWDQLLICMKNLGIMSQFLHNEDICNRYFPTCFEFQGRKVYLCLVDNCQPQPGDAPLNHYIAYTYACMEHSHLETLCPWLWCDGCSQSVMFQSYEGFFHHVGIFNTAIRVSCEQY